LTKLYGLQYLQIIIAVFHGLKIIHIIAAFLLLNKLLVLFLSLWRSQLILWLFLRNLNWLLLNCSLEDAAGLRHGNQLARAG
jgi:hypothetical protein